MYCQGTSYLLPAQESSVGSRGLNRLFLQDLLSLAKVAAEPQVKPRFFRSFSTVLRQVVQGFPLDLFPWAGVHLNDILGILSSGILRTCPNSLNLLFSISLDWYKTSLLQQVLIDLILHLATKFLEYILSIFFEIFQVSSCLSQYNASTQPHIIRLL